jgi:short-subunit dehydrogenase
MNILILGANSAIAKATARLWANEGHHLYLVGRDPNKLEALTQDLKVKSRGKIFSEAMDLVDATLHESLIKRAKNSLGKIDLVFMAHGTLGDQSACEKSWAQSLKILDENFLSQASLLTIVANEFDFARHGHIAVITSVAGDRGRAKNYIYGSAKGALSLFLGGLRNRLAAKNIPVTDFRLGFVDTPMTTHYKKGPIWAKPEAVAHGIVSAIEKKKDVVYLPWFWRWIMMVIRNIPERVFKRMKI